jgi:hypothetical protein
MGTINFRQGDHLVVPRLGYTSRGIALKKSEVIHFAGSPGGELHARVRGEPLVRFRQGAPLYVMRYQVPTLAPEATTKATSARLVDLANRERWPCGESDTVERPGTLR